MHRHSRGHVNITKVLLHRVDVACIAFGLLLHVSLFQQGQHCCCSYISHAIVNSHVIQQLYSAYIDMLTYVFGKTHKQTDANDASAKVCCIDKMHSPGSAADQVPFRGNRLASAVCRNNKM